METPQIITQFLNDNKFVYNFIKPYLKITNYQAYLKNTFETQFFKEWFETPDLKKYIKSLKYDSEYDLNKHYDVKFHASDNYDIQISVDYESSQINFNIKHNKLETLETLVNKYIKTNPSTEDFKTYLKTFIVSNIEYYTKNKNIENFYFDDFYASNNKDNNIFDSTKKFIYYILQKNLSNIKNSTFEGYTLTLKNGNLQHYYIKIIDLVDDNLKEFSTQLCNFYENTDLKKFIILINKINLKYYKKHIIENYGNFFSSYNLKIAFHSINNFELPTTTKEIFPVIKKTPEINKIQASFLNNDTKKSLIKFGLQTKIIDIYNTLKTYNPNLFKISFDNYNPNYSKKIIFDHKFGWDVILFSDETIRLSIEINQDIIDILENEIEKFIKNKIKTKSYLINSDEIGNIIKKIGYDFNLEEFDYIYDDDKLKIESKNENENEFDSNEMLVYNTIINTIIRYFEHSYTLKFPNIFTNFSAEDCNPETPEGGYDIISDSYIICCKIIDILDDDYSEILQNLKSQIETTEKYFLKEVIYILVIRKFNLTSISTSELKQIFQLSGINIYVLSEIQYNIIKDKGESDES